jgi:hypothetical protein
MKDSFPDLERMELVTGSHPGGFATWQGVLTAALAQSVDDRLLRHPSPLVRKGDSENTMTAGTKQPQKKTAKKKKAASAQRNSCKIIFVLNKYMEWDVFVDKIPKLVKENCRTC